MVFGFMQAMSAREDYADWVKREREVRQPACDQGLEECIRCGWCCAVRTCVPLPSELAAIASFLGLSIPDLISQYMVGDSILGHYFLRFANTAQRDVLGEYLSDGRTYDEGCCLLYDADAEICKIWDVRPQDARDHGCWFESDDDVIYHAIEQWKDGDLERICPDMYIRDDDW